MHPPQEHMNGHFSDVWGAWWCYMLAWPSFACVFNPSLHDLMGFGTYLQLEAEARASEESEQKHQDSVR